MQVSVINIASHQKSWDEDNASSYERKYLMMNDELWSY